MISWNLFTTLDAGAICWPKAKWLTSVNKFWRKSVLELSLGLDRAANSVTRLLVYVFNLGHLQQWNFAQKHTLFCHSGFKILPKPNKPSKYCQSLLKFCQSGEISPNLVTLVLSDATVNIANTWLYQVNNVPNPCLEKVQIPLKCWLHET